MNRRAPAVQLDRLAREIEADYHPVDYAPPETRRMAKIEETTLEQITALSAAVRDNLTSAKAELQALEEDARNVEEIYVRETTRVAMEIKTLQERVKGSREAIKKVHDHWVPPSNVPAENAAQ